MCPNPAFSEGCADLHVCGALQTVYLQTLRNPPQITAFIKRQKQIAQGVARGSDPEAGLTGFCDDMDGLLARPGLRMNFIHFSAITTAAAHIWTECQRSPQFRGHADVSGRLKALFQRCLQSLQALLTDVGSQAVSNVFWSSATLGFNPDDAVPGMVHALTSRFLQFLKVSKEKQQPNAQEAANMLWAFAAMGHPAATAQVVSAIFSHFACLTLHSDAQQRPKAQGCANAMRAVAKLGHSSAAMTKMMDSACLHFARLIEHRDAWRRPTAQECANAMWALAKLGHSSAAATKMMDSTCSHFARLVTGSPETQQRPDAQEVANMVWALGTLKHTPPDDKLLDGLCEYMRILLRSHDQRTRPNAQEIANTVWGLAQLKHAPSHDVVTAVFEHLVDLCHAPGLQPDSQSISNSFTACANLQLVMQPTYIEALLKRFMDMHVSDVRYQEYCNLAWSLAVMQSLDLNTFEALLDQLTTKQTMSVQGSGSHNSSAQLTTAEARQLYQALAWLMLPSSSQQTKSWSSLQSRLQTVAPEPAFKKLSMPGQPVMWAALAMQGVP